MELPHSKDWFARRTMFRSLKHPAIRFQRANISFSPCQHFHTSRVRRTTAGAPPEPPKRRRSPSSQKRQVESSNDRITLPNYLDWRSVFPPSKLKDRISVSNPESAAEMAEAFVPKGSLDKVVIEAFPGEK